MLPSTQDKAFRDFYDCASQNENLDEKTTVMIQIASAMAVGCYP